jgi:hypothetical protein
LCCGQNGLVILAPASHIEQAPQLGLARGRENGTGGASAAKTIEN